jgi:hypothetical protein
MNLLDRYKPNNRENMAKNLSINISGSGSVDQLAVRLIEIGRALQVSNVYNSEIELSEDLKTDGVLNIEIQED